MSEEYKLYGDMYTSMKTWPRFENNCVWKQGKMALGKNKQMIFLWYLLCIVQLIHVVNRPTLCRLDDQTRENGGN